MPFQIVRVEFNDSQAVIARTRLQPTFELRDDAMALAEFDALRCGVECDFDAVHDCWWGWDLNGRKFRLIVEPTEAECDRLTC